MDEISHEPGLTLGRRASSPFGALPGRAGVEIRFSLQTRGPSFHFCFETGGQPLMPRGDDRENQSFSAVLGDVDQPNLDAVELAGGVEQTDREPVLRALNPIPGTE